MLYTDFTAGNKDYKLRLSTRNIVALEKQLGANPFLFLEMAISSQLLQKW